MAELDTLPKLLRRNRQKYGDRKLAMAKKDFGRWQSYSWEDYYEKVKYFSLGLISLGLEPEDKVSLLGETDPELYWAELAVQAARATVVGIFTDCLHDEIKYFASHSDSKFIIVEDQEQTDKVLAIKDELPLLRKVIYWDPKGLANYDAPILISFNEVTKLGKEYDQLHPDLFEKNVDGGKGEDICAFCYTSGTTGLPKGVMLSHKALINANISWVTKDRWNDSYQYVSFLPIAWVTEQSMLASALYVGLTVNFPEEPETVQEDIREVAPSLLFWGARQWESLNRLIQAKIIDTTAFNRLLYNLCLPVGYKIADLEFVQQKPNLLWRILNKIAYWLVFRDLVDKVGLGKLECPYTGGAQISPDVIRYFHAIGLKIRILYGASEYPIVSGHDADTVRSETAGSPLSGVEVRLSPDGELLIKGENVFSGYYKDADAYNRRFKDGWFYSDDFAYISDDNQLIIMDRMGDLRPLSGERKFSPQYIESRLRFSPFIKDVLVVGGEDKEFVSALVNIDRENVGRWAEARRVAYTTYVDLCQKPEVVTLVQKEIERVNKMVPEWMQLKKFINIHKEFDPDEAELTRTRKIKRAFMEGRYHELIEGMYSGGDKVTVEAPITYQDGRKGTIKTTVKVNPVD